MSRISCKLAPFVFAALCGIAAGPLSAQGLSVGDTVVVTSEAANVMAGQMPIAVVARGQRFQVRNFNQSGSYALISFSMRGRPTSGWVRVSDLALAADEAPPVSAYYPPTQQAYVPPVQYVPQQSYYYPQTYYYPQQHHHHGGYNSGHHHHGWTGHHHHHHHH